MGKDRSYFITHSAHSAFLVSLYTLTPWRFSKLSGLLSVINKDRASYVVIENRRCCSKTRPHQHSRGRKIPYEIGNPRHGDSRDTPSLFLLPDVLPTAHINNRVHAYHHHIEDCFLCFSFVTKHLQYNIRWRQDYPCLYLLNNKA